MAKKKNETIFKCCSCGHTLPRWMGRCPNCSEWNTFELCSNTKTNTKSSNGQIQEPVKLSTINPMSGERLLTGISEFDRVLGGGAMKHSAILIGGEPGIGKSTLLLQTAASISKLHKDLTVLYVSGEESGGQIRSRADRLNLQTENIHLLCTSNLEDIENSLNSLKPNFCVVDSIQTIYNSETGLIPGSINQLKYSANELISWVKENNSVLILVAHITKEGIIAGPKSLEHMVDTVISFEKNNDDVRFLRAQKNRFGSVDELGIFSMQEKGLLPIEDPSAMFITQRSTCLPAGVSIVPVFEGSRVFLVEIQALTVSAKATTTRVYSDKIDFARVSRISAVLEKSLGLKFSDQDIYINVAGGIKLTESAIDAALAAALYSARTSIPIPEGTAIIGELSLAGEIRPIQRTKQRVKTANSLGFKKIIVPEKIENTEFCSDIKSLVKMLFKNS